MQAGGAERTISLLSDYAARQGDSVTILTMDGLPSFYPLHSAVNHLPLNIYTPSVSFVQTIRFNYGRMKHLRNVYQKLQPDVVLCVAPNTILLSFLARGGLKYKLIGSERSNPYYSSIGGGKKGRKWISTLCDGYLFQTEGARGYYPAVTRKKSIISPNCIVPASFAALDRPWEERKHICAVGRMDANKCFDDLLAAFAMVQKKHPAVQLDLYGDGPLRVEMESLATSLGLQASVVFHGRCKTMLEEFGKHKLFAMTSQLEGMPNVLMEALASGCACVAANCDFGPSELIHDGINGFLVPVHDTDAMADRLCLLLEDHALCQRFSQAALSIRQTHDVEIIGATFRAYLNKL